MATDTTSDIVKGILLWFFVMLIPLLVLFIKNGEVKAALLTLVYPNLLAFLSRSGRFWISNKVIAAASIVTFLVSLLLRLIPSVKKALDDPTNNQAISASILALLVFIFFVIIAVSGLTFGMYNSNVQ